MSSHTISWTELTHAPPQRRCCVPPPHAADLEILASAAQRGDVSLTNAQHAQTRRSTLVRWRSICLVVCALLLRVTFILVTSCVIPAFLCATNLAFPFRMSSPRLA